MTNVIPLKIDTGEIAQMGATDTVPPANLGTGVRDGTRVLRDDGVWVVVAASGAGTGDYALFGGL